jgi:glutathione S-transferase
MKLYSALGSCSTASNIALLEAGADFEVIKLNLATDRLLPDGRHLNDVNPKGYVPVLELDDGTLLTENVAILQYIADQFPKSQLAPPNGTMARVRLQEWLSFVNSEVHKTMSNFYNPRLPPEMRDFFNQRLGTRFDYIDAHLDGKNFLLGGDCSVADYYLFVVCSWAPRLKVDLSGYKNILEWQARVAARPAVQEVMSALQ